jgi:hypothetical protein
MSKEADIIEAFVTFAGIERFNRFVRVLNESAAGKRQLLWWQEKLWEDFCKVHSVDTAGTFVELARMFAHQPLRKQALTKETFLADPSRHWLSPDAVIDETWIGEAWENQQFRENLTYLLSRSLSKVGTLYLAGDLPTVLSRVLKETQVRDLYIALRAD